VAGKSNILAKLGLNILWLGSKNHQRLSSVGRSYHENVKEKREKMPTTLHFLTISNFSGLDDHNMTMVIFHPLSHTVEEIILYVVKVSCSVAEIFSPPEMVLYTNRERLDLELIIRIKVSQSLLKLPHSQRSQGSKVQTQSD